MKKFVFILAMLLCLAPAAAMAVEIAGAADLAPAVVVRRNNPQPTDSPKPTKSPTLSESATVGFAGHEWVIIGWNGGGVASTSNTATMLLSDADANKPANSRFHATSNVYESSDLQTALGTFFNDLPAAEKGYVVPRNLAGNCGSFFYSTIGSLSVVSFNEAAGSAAANQYAEREPLEPADTFDWYAYHDLRTKGLIGTGIVLNAYSGSYHPDRVRGSSVSGQAFWPLSVAEASLLEETIRKYNATWWLRSSGVGTSTVTYVEDNGRVGVSGSMLINNIRAVRPAFNLNLSSVLLASAANGKKLSVGSALSKADTPAGDVKFTMMDSSIKLTSVTNIAASGKTVTFDYAGATTGKILSAIVMDNKGSVKYYGKLAASTTAKGSAKVTLPDDFDAAKHTLQVFVEEINGPNLTDFASAPIIVSTTITVKIGGEEIKLPAGTVIAPDGTITFPGGSGTATLPGGVKAELPSGTKVDKDEGTITVPQGGNATVKIPDGTSIKLPDGSVINVPAMTVTVGPGGATVTYPDGTTKTFPAGSVIKMAAVGKGGGSGGGGGGCAAGFGIYGALALAALWVARKKH